MNDVYFSCPQSGLFVDAGYRWAYAMLEQPGIVTMGQQVDVDAVLDCQEYWSPPEDKHSHDLRLRILPVVTRFLNHHRSQTINYVDRDVIFDHLPDVETGDEPAEPWFEIKQ